MSSVPKVVEWDRDMGVEGLQTIVKRIKVGIKRSHYNWVNNKTKELRNVCVSQSNAQQVIYNLDRFKKEITAKREEFGDLVLLDDTDVLKQAASKFARITIQGAEARADLGELNITYRGTTYRIGQFQLVVSTGNGRIRAFNLNSPVEASGLAHPHVQGSGNICFGTWRDYITRLLQKKYNWLRVMVMTAEFLRGYTPEGGPYIRLAKGWRNRVVNGEQLCTECEKGGAECGCNRCRNCRQFANQCTCQVCPKTGDSLEHKPDTDYCVGCRHYWENVDSENETCVYPISAVEFGRSRMTEATRIEAEQRRRQQALREQELEVFREEAEAIRARQSQAERRENV